MQDYNNGNKKFNWFVHTLIANIWVGMDKISNSADITSNMYESYFETCRSWSSNLNFQLNN
jgi:hypothetical protein